MNKYETKCKKLIRFYIRKSAFYTLEELEILDCENNQLTSLPSLNEKLKIVRCRCNQLTSLPTLNKTLEFLNCYNYLVEHLHEETDLDELLDKK